MNNTFRIGRNKVSLLQNGSLYFPLLCADIDAAQQSVFLETYIFAADETARVVSQALQRAAKRKVEVRLLLDGYGSSGLPQQWVDELIKAGVEVHWFRREISPFTLRPNRMRRLRRMHRKLAVIDGKVAFIGGINIVNDIPNHEDFDAPRLDYAVRVEGKVVQEIQHEMQYLWSIVRWATLRKRFARLRARMHGMHAKKPATDVELVLRDNLRHRRDIEHAYLQAIGNARREIIIASAYFLPGRVFRRALRDAAKRGVRVVLLLQGRVEYYLQHYATLALYGQLLQAGIEIYEYRDSYMHAKVGVVDGEWATVGSSNLEPFSMLLAQEANLIVRDEKFAGALRSSLLRAISTSAQRVEHTTWQPFVVLMARLSYGLIRLVVGLSGISRRH